MLFELVQFVTEGVKQQKPHDNLAWTEPSLRLQS